LLQGRRPFVFLDQLRLTEGPRLGVDEQRVRWKLLGWPADHQDSTEGGLVFLWPLWPPWGCGTWKWGIAGIVGIVIK
jgi:hypothetical protein